MSGTICDTKGLIIDAKSGINVEWIAEQKYISIETVRKISNRVTFRLCICGLDLGLGLVSTNKENMRDSTARNFCSFFLILKT